MFKNLLFNKNLMAGSSTLLRPTNTISMISMFNMMTLNSTANRVILRQQSLLTPRSVLMGSIPRFTFIARAPQGLSEYQEEKKTILPFTTQYMWNNTGARTTYKQVGRGPGSGLG